ncbi:MAG: MFS transporter [Gaiellaceae bacterium]
MSVAADARIPENRRTIAGYYTLAGLYTLSAAAIWGVNTLFLLDAGLSFFEVFVANGAFSLGTVLFEIPTGVVADTLGRRISFLLSVSVLGVSTLAYVGLAEIDAGVIAFAAASVAMALGFTFYSGAMEAWLVDALAATGYRGLLDRVFARGSQVTGAAMLVGTIGGGFLGQIDLSIPYLLRSALLVAVFALAFVVMHDVGFTPRPVPASRLPAEIARNARAGVAFGWGQRPLRLLMLASFLQLGFLSWAFYASQPYLLELLESDAIWVVGIVAAAIALSTIVGNQVVSIAARRCGRRTTLLLAAGALQTGAAIVLGVASSFWVALPALLLFTAGLGVTSPVRQAYLHQLVPSEQRATVVSFDSMVSGAGGVGAQVGLGALGEARSVGSAFVVGGLATAGAIPLFAAVRRFGGRADEIADWRGGVESSCPHGLPAVATVDAVAVDRAERAIAART